MRDNSELVTQRGEWTVQYYDPAEYSNEPPAWKTIIFYSIAEKDWLEAINNYEVALNYMLNSQKHSSRSWRLRHITTGEIIPGDLFHE